MSRSITLMRDPITEAQVGTIKGYRLSVGVIDAEGLSEDIFVYHVQMMDPFTREQRAEFSHVSVPADLEELPVNGVTPDSPLDFRLNTLDVLFSNLEDLETYWNSLKDDVRYLLGALGRMDILAVEDDFEIGDFYECRQSSSSSPQPEPSSSSSSPGPEPSSSSSSPAPPAPPSFLLGGGSLAEDAIGTGYVGGSALSTPTAPTFLLGGGDQDLGD